MTKRGRFDSPIEENPFAVCPYVRNECENSVSMQKSIMLINIKDITPTALFASLPFFLFSFAVFKHPGAQKTTSIFKNLSKLYFFSLMREIWCKALAMKLSEERTVISKITSIRSLLIFSELTARNGSFLL